MLLNRFSLEKDFNKDKKPKFIKNIRHYMSESTHTFQLGLVSEQEWIGEDFLVIKNGIYQYSVIAKTKEVEALEISKPDMIKLSKDFDFIKHNTRKRLQWINERFNEITETCSKISKMDSQSEMIEETLSQISKQYPRATDTVIHKIHTQRFLMDSQPKQQNPSSWVSAITINTKFFRHTTKQTTQPWTPKGKTKTRILRSTFQAGKEKHQETHHQNSKN